MALKPIEIAPVEAAMAVIGIRPILFGDVGRIYAEDLHYMETIHKEIIRKSRTCVNGEGEKIRPVNIDYHKFLKVLSDGITEEKIKDAIDRFPSNMGEVATLIGIHATSIAEQLNAFIPKSEYQTLSGTTPLAPSDTRLWKFFAIVDVLDDPLSVFDLIAKAALLRSQARAVQAVYPTLSKAISAAIDAAIKREKANKKSWEVNPRAEYGIKAWMDQPPISPKLLAMAQANAQELTDQKKLSDRQPAKPQKSLGDRVNFQATQPQAATEEALT